MRADLDVLSRRVEAAREILTSCELCPRRCRVDRLRGELGFCRVGRDPMVSSYGSHFGEEPPLGGTRKLVRFVAEHISRDTYINIMAQYRPCFKAHGCPPLDRRVRYQEVEEARELARKSGLHRGFDDPFS